MDEVTISATFDTERINRELSIEPINSTGLQFNLKIVFDTENITHDQHNPIFIYIPPNVDLNQELKSEFEIWESASDEDLLMLEANDGLKFQHFQDFIPS